MSGKLTAEQVREIVEKHWHDLPAEYDMPEATALPEYSYDWQAIADELKATLGGEDSSADDALALLDEIREAGRISYDDYSRLFDAIAALGGGERESSKERLQKMLDEMKKLARDGRREWCGRSHGEFDIFVALDDFAKTTKQRIDRPWMWR